MPFPPADLPPRPRWFAGLDENGLGPRLGPLVVTGVLARAENDAAARLAEGPALKSLASRLGDSKKLVCFGDSALGEAWGRVLARRRGDDPQTPAQLLELLALDDGGTLRGRCPDEGARMCWGVAGERFEAGEELMAQVEADCARLEKKGLHVERARVALVCVRRLNEAKARGETRLDVDLHSMERLFLALRGDAGPGLVARCGKVGGIDRYAPRFRLLQPEPGSAVEERQEASYRVAGARIHFVLDAEPKHMLVALASLVGKWARDLLTTRVVRHLRASDPSLPVASGYHDPLTRRLVEESAAQRAASGLPDDCFERS